MFGCCFWWFLAVPLPADLGFEVHRFTFGLLWRWCPTTPSLRALGHVLVPLICLYIVCFALPGDSSFSGSSSGDYARTRELSSLSANTWEAVAGV